MDKKRILLTSGKKIRPFSERVLTTQPAALMALWEFDEASGPTAFDSSGHKEDMLLNGTFETAGGGGLDVVANWTESAGDGVIALTSTAGEFRSGTKALKLTAGPNRNTFLVQTVNCVPGSSVSFPFWTRGDGTNAGRYRVRDNTNAVDLVATVTTGVTGATWAQITPTVTAPAGCIQINIYFYCPNVGAGFACFDDAQALIPMDGDYSATGITYGQPGLRAGETCVSFDGNNGYMLWNKTAINQAWNPDKGSVAGWAKVDAAARWAEDGVSARWWFHPRAADVNYYMAIGKEITPANTIGFRRRAGAANPIESVTYTTTSTEWIMWGMTWDTTANELIAYINGVEVGRDTCAGTWDKAANPITAAGSTVMYAGSTTLQEWIGSGGPVAVWAGVVLTPAEMLNLKNR